MKVITAQGMVGTVARRWAIQYANTTDPDKIRIGGLLKALPLTATPRDLYDIIGNWSWTNLVCDDHRLVSTGRTICSDSPMFSRRDCTFPQSARTHRKRRAPRLWGIAPECGGPGEFPGEGLLGWVHFARAFRFS